MEASLLVQGLHGCVDCAIESDVVGEGVGGEMVRLEIMPDDLDVVQLGCVSVRAWLRAKEIASLSWAMLTDAEGMIGDAIHLVDEASKGSSGRVIAPFIAPQPGRASLPRGPKRPSRRANAGAGKQLNALQGAARGPCPEALACITLTPRPLNRSLLRLDVTATSRLG
jgi:hypothetical protein